MIREDVKDKLQLDKYYTNCDIANIFKLTLSTAEKLTESLQDKDGKYKGSEVLNLYKKGIIYLR